MGLSWLGVKMTLYVKLLRKSWLVFILSLVVYTSALCVSIYIRNSNSLIYYHIEPYIYGSEPVDFFFSLIVTIPFSWILFYLKKNKFIDYVKTRISDTIYIRTQIISLLTLCFLIVFIANIIAVLFSVNIARISANSLGKTLAGYILGDMQMANPVLFGIIWSFYKACVGTMICMLGQVIALYVKNFFLVVILPFIYVFLENFTTSILMLSKYSITTSFVLNRLKARAMLPQNLLIAIIQFIIVIIMMYFFLGKYDEKYNKA